MSDAYTGGSVPAEEEVELYVLVVQGVGPEAIARVETDEREKYTVSAEVLAEQTGLPVDQLSGNRVVATVRDGELAGFRLAGR